MQLSIFTRKHSSAKVSPAPSLPAGPEHGSVRKLRHGGELMAKLPQQKVLRWSYDARGHGAEYVVESVYAVCVRVYIEVNCLLFHMR